MFVKPAPTPLTPGICALLAAILVLALPAAAQEIAPGASVRGELGPGDPVRSDGSYYRIHWFTARATERVVITLTSRDFDAFLTVGRATGSGAGAGTVDQLADRASDDDGGGGTNARLEYDVQAGSVYGIVANTYTRGGTGSYELMVRSSSGSGSAARTTPERPAPTQAPARQAPARMTLDQAADAMMEELRGQGLSLAYDREHRVIQSAPVHLSLSPLAGEEVTVVVLEENGFAGALIFSDGSGLRTRENRSVPGIMVTAAGISFPTNWRAGVTSGIEIWAGPTSYAANARVMVWTNR